LGKKGDKIRVLTLYWLLNLLKSAHQSLMKQSWKQLLATEALLITLSQQAVADHWPT